MKLKYLFPLFIAVVAFMTSCNDENTMTLLDEVQVSASYVAIPVDGGSNTITITANDSWTLEKIVTKKDSVKWLSISAASGVAGKNEVTFSAPSALDGRTAEVLLHSGGKTQRINIIQGVAKISEATAAEVNAGLDGKTFRVTGVCTAIQNTKYGNWYLTDETGSVYIYGTLDAKGGTKNFLSLGMEVGDEVTIEGPKSSYKGNPQMVNVSVIKINKSLVKVDSVENEVLPVEGGEFTAHLTCKGQGVSVDIPEDAKSWLSISSVQQAGTDAVVKFKAAANTGGDRQTTITFNTTEGGKKYSTQTMLTQKGAIVKATIAEFLAAEVGNTQYRLAGIITKIENDKYGNLHLRDFSGETFVYGIKDFKEKGLKVGDIITIVGKRAKYKDTPQVAGAVLESVISVVATNIAEVQTKPDSEDVFYMLSGEITEIKNDLYGNLFLKDGDDVIYLYGCYPGYGATGDDRKGLITAKGIKVGDKLTVIANKGSYKGDNQLVKGIYFSHESSE